jgi:hypothetical protein
VSGSLSLSDRIRAGANRRGRRAFENYTNGNRKDARALLVETSPLESAMATAVFLSLSNFAPSARAFVDRFADF